MSLIDRYIAQVGRHLPDKDRNDIEAEIRSMLEDMVDEQNQTGVTNEAGVTAVLQQLGDPALLAEKYSPPKRYLIGPSWYEFYVKILQRVLVTALPVVTMVIFILTLTKDPLDFINAVGEAVGSAFGVGLQILFWITIVFVFLERSDEVPPNELSRQNNREWTVADLPLLPKTRQISIPETVIDIASILFVLVWIVLPSTLASFRGEPNPVPFLHPNLWNFWLPLFFVLMGLTLIHEVFKLKIGNWTPALTVTNVILGTLSIIYLAMLVITQDLISPAFLPMLDNAEGLSELREMVRWNIDISAAVIAGIYLWSMVDSVIKSKRLVNNEARRTK